jgi:hypothetical protein
MEMISSDGLPETSPLAKDRQTGLSQPVEDVSVAIKIRTDCEKEIRLRSVAAGRMRFALHDAENQTSSMDGDDAVSGPLPL